jgi:GMP synthase (glutamine-hydrolysing)
VQDTGGERTARSGATLNSHHDHGFLSRVADRIINDVRGIDHDITSKPSGTIEWE